MRRHCPGLLKRPRHGHGHGSDHGHGPSPLALACGRGELTPQLWVRAVWAAAGTSTKKRGLFSRLHCTASLDQEAELTPTREVLAVDFRLTVNLKFNAARSLVTTERGL